MPGALPRFSGPDRARVRMRFATAIGMLAVAGLATGALATLTFRDAAQAEPGEMAPPLRELSTSDTPTLLHPAGIVEARVEQAEAAVSQARAAVRSARQLGIVDPERLEQLEHRLELLGHQPRRVFGDSFDSTVETPRAAVDDGPREL